AVVLRHARAVERPHDAEDLLRVVAVRQQFADGIEGGGQVPLVRVETGRSGHRWAPIFGRADQADTGSCSCSAAFRTKSTLVSIAVTGSICPPLTNVSLAPGTFAANASPFSL